MKKILHKLRVWLLGLLGGVSITYYNAIIEEAAGRIIELKEKCKLTEAYQAAVREICRRSESSYYDWCCEYCAAPCDKRNGWCERFTPKDQDKFTDKKLPPQK